MTREYSEFIDRVLSLRLYELGSVFLALLIVTQNSNQVYSVCIAVQIERRDVK